MAKRSKSGRKVQKKKKTSKKTGRKGPTIKVPEGSRPTARTAVIMMKSGS
jgi:hypothetical protein